MPLYDTIGHGYAKARQPDPRLARIIDAALAGAKSVVNVGAGTGSYEPTNREVIAVEPSELMIAQRPPHSARCLQGTADALPLESKSTDAAMAILSAHHWPDLARGVQEMARVARHRAILLTWVPDSSAFWLTQDYFPEILAHDRTIFPDIASLTAMLRQHIGPTTLTPVPIPHDCIDGMLCAYWRRPDAYLREDVRRGMSSFSRIDAAAGLNRLRADLASGTWHARNAHLLALEELDLGYRLAVCEIDAQTPTTT